MHEAFNKKISNIAIAPIIETGENDIANSNNQNGAINYSQSAVENDFDVDNFYQGLRNLVFLGAILMIVFFCRFCVLWIGAEDNNYMMIDFEIPFMK